MNYQTTLRFYQAMILVAALFGMSCIVLYYKRSTDLQVAQQKVERLNSFCRVTKNTLSILPQSLNKGTNELLIRGFVEDRVNFGPSSVRLCLTKLPDGEESCGSSDNECVLQRIELYRKELDKRY